MGDTPRIEGTPDPRQSSSSKKESAIDPEKFKKILKVDESEETEKRRKRNLAKSEEDSEDEIDDIENNKTPETLFNSFMKDSGPSTSIFDPQSGSKQPLGSNSDTPSTSFGDPFDNAETTVPPPLPAPIEEPSFDEPSVEGEILSSPPEPQSSSSQDETDNKQDRNKKEIKRNFKKAKLEEKSSVAKMPPAPPKQKPLPHKLKEKPLSHLVKKEKKETTLLKTQKDENREDVAIPIEPKKGSQSLAKESIVDELSLAKKNRSSQLTSPEKDDEKRKRDAKHVEESQVETAGQHDPSIPFISPTAPPEALPSYAHFSKEVFDLFERMVGLITVEQSKGVSTTTVKISLPGTVYHGSEIKLDHYDTAPHSFNIQLIGSPEAIKSFTANFDDLAAAFRGGKFAFTVNLLEPELSSKYRHLIKRKASPDGQSHQDGDESPK